MITLKISPVNVKEKVLSNVLVRSDLLNITYNIQQSTLEQEVILKDSTDWVVVKGIEAIKILNNSTRSIVKTSSLEDNQEYLLSFNLVEEL